MLRAATAAKILDGWQGPHVTARSYCIAPSTGGAIECPLEYVIGYCKMLALAGVEPLYRESEPRHLGPETSREPETF
jgi:hypothetical protein